MNLETRFAAWRQSMQAGGIGPGEKRDELESHLRDGFEERVRAGMTEEAAFAAAAEKLGQPAVIQQEFKSALTWRTRLSRLFTEPVGVFPADLTVCARFALPVGIYIIGLAFLAAYQLNSQIDSLAAAGQYDLHELTIDLLAPALVALIGLQLVLPAVGYLRTRSISHATRLASTWTFIFWIFGNGLVSNAVPFIPGSSSILYGLGLLLSLIAGYLVERTWAKRLLSAQSKQAD